MRLILLGAILVAIGSLISGHQFGVLQDIDRRPLLLTPAARPIAADTATRFQEAGRDGDLAIVGVERGGSKR